MAFSQEKQVYFRDLRGSCHSNCKFWISKITPFRLVGNQSDFMKLWNPQKALERTGIQLYCSNNWTRKTLFWVLKNVQTKQILRAVSLLRQTGKTSHILVFNRFSFSYFESPVIHFLYDFMRYEFANIRMFIHTGTGKIEKRKYWVTENNRSQRNPGSNLFSETTKRIIFKKRLKLFRKPQEKRQWLTIMFLKLSEACSFSWKHFRLRDKSFRGSLSR